MWDAWTDLALGSRCAVCDLPGRVLCRHCDRRLPRAGYRVRPDPEPVGLAPTFVAGPYADPLRRLVLAHKEHRVLGLAAPLGRILADVVTSAVPGGAEVALVAVPSSPGTVRRRGHDPLARTVRAAAGVLRRSGRGALVPVLLRQYRPVADQAGLDAEGRAENLNGSLAVVGRAHRALAGRPVVLVVCDDVVTTGATAREAQRALETNGLTVSAVAAVAATGRRSVGPSSARSLPICSPPG